jgi:hypothetical protein
MPPLGGAPSYFEMRVRPGTTLSGLVREVYGSADPQLLAQVKALNVSKIADVDHIFAGDTLLMPLDTLETR